MNIVIFNNSSSATKLLVAWAVFLSALLNPTPAIAQGPIPTLNLPKDSIARIEANQCPSPEAPALAIQRNNGTGFVWRDRETLVTAYHVVAGCRQVSVWFPGKTMPVSATLSEQSLANRDIAILTLSEVVDAYPLEFRNIHPPTGFIVQLLGHSLGAGAIATKPLTVASIFGDDWPLLEEILSTQGKAAVSRTHQSIELDTKVIQVNGEITNGLSGAPVFDFEGYVVGIASGSVGIGSSERVNWAISGFHLNDIYADSDILSMTSATPTSLIEFGDGGPRERPKRLQCGLVSFDFYESASLRDLYLRSKQQELLNNAFQIQMLDGADLDALFFDIWVDDKSGMQIATPTGAKFVDQPSRPCSMSVGDDAFLQIFTYVAPNTGEYQRLQHFQTASNQFTARIQSEIAVKMIIDNAMTSNLSRESDRYFFKRDAAFHHKTTGLGQNLSNYAIATHHGRERYYIGVAALHRDYTNSNQVIVACQQDRNSDVCSAFRESTMPWSSALVAIHLSSMPER